jgi:hypothetical protein
LREGGFLFSGMKKAAPRLRIRTMFDPRLFQRQTGVTADWGFRSRCLPLLSAKSVGKDRPLGLENCLPANSKPLMHEVRFLGITKYEDVRLKYEQRFAWEDTGFTAIFPNVL